MQIIGNPGTLNDGNSNARGRSKSLMHDRSLFLMATCFKNRNTSEGKSTSSDVHVKTTVSKAWFEHILSWSFFFRNLVSAYLDQGLFLWTTFSTMQSFYWMLIISSVIVTCHNHKIRITPHSTTRTELMVISNLPNATP